MPDPRVHRSLLEFRTYRRRFRKPLATAHGLWSTREGVIVQLTDFAGNKGFGEAAPVPGFTSETTAQDVAWLKQHAGKISPSALSRVPARLGSLRWALTCAQAMAQGRFAANCLRNSLSVAALLPAGNAAPSALAKNAAAGYHTFKWKVAVHSRKVEFGLLDQLLAALPKTGKLRLDANGGLTEEELSAWLAYLTAAGDCAQLIEFFEQPLAPARHLSVWKAQRLLADAANVPITLDESVATLANLDRARSLRWPGPLVVKPSLLGELPAFLQWRTKSKADLVYSSAFETSVGLHAALWLAATDPQAGKWALGFGTLDAFADDGLRLPAHAPGPTLTPTPLTAADFAELWNRLPNSR